MGRLFWKFFLFCLAAQLITILGVSAAIQWRHGSATEWRDRPGADAPPHPPRFEPRPGFAPDGSPRAGIAPDVAPRRPPPPRRGPIPPIVPLIGGIVASLVFAAFLAWYVAKPVRSLRGAFDAAARGDLDVRVTPQMGRRRDELADLGREFDRTSVRLKALIDGQRRLLHDVSHELRSPLARLRIAVGLARQQPDRIDDWVERIDRESVRMDTLVDELLTLSRLESGMASAPPGAVDVGELLDEVVGDARFEADANGRRLAWRIDASAAAGRTLRGHAELLQRAIENIVRNAMKHTPDGGEIAIEAHADRGGGLRLAVADTGSGVPEGELEAIFRPFFRSANAKDTDGHGVGLAIAHGVVALHGGAIRAMNRDGGGLRVEIVLPAGRT